MKKRRAHVWISGRVQGVFFRGYTEEAACRIGVAGWARNIADGRVEAVFEGDADKIEKMIDWCWEGSPFSRVEKVEVVEEVYSGDSDRFVIIH